MTAIPMPTFVKTVFDSFPLVQLPPLRPTMKEDPTSYTLPETALSSGSALPTLHVLSNHSQSLAIQLLLYRHSARLQETIRVTCTTPESNHVHPYIVLPQNETLDRANLSRWVNRIISKRDSGSEDAEKNKDMDCIAFQSLLRDLDDTMILAKYLDIESTRILGPWHAQIIKPSPEESRLVATGWDKQVGLFRDAIRALQTFVATSDLSEDGEAMSGSNWVILQIVAHVHVMTKPGNAQLASLNKQAELKRLLEGCPELMRKCGEIMKDAKDKILF